MNLSIFVSLVTAAVLFPDAEGFQEKQNSIIIREELEHLDLLVIAVVRAGFAIPRKSFSVRH